MQPERALEELYAHSPDGSAEAFIDSFYVLLARLATLPVMTVAAVNGPAFAGGLLLACTAFSAVMVR